ncbi:hypothetical protein G6F61_012730 [Rhizopus arrhizus]|nr:hypothetical protein G6F61_012730 [Rhizopus arrhizus]
MSKECPSPARSKTNGTKPFKKQRKINRPSEQVEHIDSPSTAQLPASHELLKSQWAPPKSPTIQYNDTQTQAIVEDQSFFSSNPFEALHEKSKESDDVEKEDDEMNDLDYDPEGDDEDSSTDDDNDSVQEISPEEVDILMKDVDDDTDNVDSNITSSAATSVKLRTYVSSPNQLELPAEQSSQPALSNMKTSSATTQSFYIRYLREQQFDILSLQETHATPSTIPSMDTQFQAQQTFWTYYCGIVSFSTNYILTQIHTDHIFTSDRFLLCKVHHPHNFYEPFYILNVYAPADSNGARRSFFESMVTLLYELNDIITWNNLIISGDFNYDLARDIDSKRGLFKTSTAWTSPLENFFFNSMIHNSMNNIPTFQRTASITSTIDYIYLGGIIKSRLIDNSDLQN